MSRLILTMAAMASALSLSAFGSAQPARADANAPVCAMIYDQGGSRRECDFYNYAECRATISGRGGYCMNNPYYRDSFNQGPYYQ